MSTPKQEPNKLTHGPDEQEQAVQKYVKQLLVFRIHAAVFAGSMAINLVVNLLVNLSAGIAGQWSAWWSAWALIGWGSGIIVHGLVVRLNRPASSSQTWQRRQIEGELAR